MEIKSRKDFNALRDKFFIELEKRSMSQTKNILKWLLYRTILRDKFILFMEQMTRGYATTVAVKNFENYTTLQTIEKLKEYGWN